ncbi:MAG TPA: glycosyltransferase [Solirubrobacteraceae bacterium]|nr:glycosyltransferase [Solirubrobacteraceae bacterium]
MSGSAAAAEPTQESVRAQLRSMIEEALPAGEARRLIDGERHSPRWPAAPESPAPAPRGAGLGLGLSINVAYLLPGLPPEGSGGSHSLVQEARGLRELGAHARICIPEESLQTAAALYGNEDDLFVLYRGSSALVAIAEAEVVVATEYPSVDLLAELARERPRIVCAYYVQDYEPLFAAPRSSRSDRALLSYRAIPGQLLFAKTDWLRGVVSALHGVPVAKVTPSLDRKLFHAQGRVESEHVLRVAAMVRPRTPRRRPAATLRALSTIAEALGEDGEITTFGCDESSFAEIEGHFADGIRHLGLLSRRQVAELMRRSDVFVDASAYQAFGRTGLEAMACGAVPVLPELGGVHEYAEHDANAIVLADGAPERIAEVVVELARERQRERRLRGAGIRAAQGFSIERAARSQLELFSSCLAHSQAIATVSAP